MRVLMPHCGLASHSTSGGEVMEREIMTLLPRYGVDPDVLPPKWRGLRWWNSPLWFETPKPWWRIDLIRAHSLRYTGLPALWWGRKLGLKVTVHYHHLEQDRLSWLDRFVLRRADQITTDSEFSARQAADIRACQYVVRLGVDHKRFAPLPKPRYPIVVLIGGEKKRKNTQFVRDLWPQVTERVPSALMLMVGEGQHQHDDAYVTMMRAARVVAFPSLLEGFGLPVLEAMASARPVVCSDRGSLPEFGIECTPLVKRLWVDRLVHLLTDDGEWVKESLRNYELSQAYSWENTAQEFARVWSVA